MHDGNMSVMVPSKDSMVPTAFEGSRNHVILWNLSLRSTLKIPEIPGLFYYFFCWDLRNLPTPTEPSSKTFASCTARHQAMARNRRIGRGRLGNLLESADCQHGGGGEALVTGVFLIKKKYPFWCLCGTCALEVNRYVECGLCRWCFIVSTASVLLGVLSDFRAVNFGVCLCVLASSECSRTGGS